jgi:hypothetical protein
LGQESIDGAAVMHAASMHDDDEKKEKESLGIVVVRVTCENTIALLIALHYPRRQKITVATARSSSPFHSF